MNPILTRTLTFLALIVVGGSFLPVLTVSSVPSLSLLFAFSIASSLSVGFRKAWPVAMLAGLSTDIATFGTPGFLAAFCVGLSYAAGFSSRRLVTEYGPFTFVLGGAAVAVAVHVSREVSAVLSGGVSAPSWDDVFLTLVSGPVSFWAMMVFLRRLDRWTSRFEATGLIR